MYDWLHYFCGEWEGYALVNWLNQTSWVTAVTPTDRPKSVRKSCVIKVFGGVFMLLRCFLDCSVGVGGFVTWLSQTSSFFSSPHTSLTHGKYGSSDGLEKFETEPSRIFCKSASATCISAAGLFWMFNTKLSKYRTPTFVDCSFKLLLEKWTTLGDRIQRQMGYRAHNLHNQER